jgi:hypothetical protein
VRVFDQQHESARLQHGGAQRPGIESGRHLRRSRDMFDEMKSDEMAEEIAWTAVPLLGQLAHVHLESNLLQFGRHYQLDCRLLLPV